jgi:ketosteroid isomerase-like protein
MAKKKIFVGMVVLCLCICAEAKQKKAKAANPAQEIRNVLDKQVAAWNRGDLEGFMAAYWQAPKLSFYSGGTKTHGWQQTIDRYRNRYQSEGREMGRLDFTDLEIETLSPLSAFVRGHWRLKMKDGEPGGLFTLIFRKHPDGWKIVHDHTSSQ